MTVSNNEMAEGIVPREKVTRGKRGFFLKNFSDGFRLDLVGFKMAIVLSVLSFTNFIFILFCDTNDLSSL